jgi:hypothetical protein
MVITAWKPEEELEVGKLVNYRGTYLVVSDIEKASCMLVNPFNMTQFMVSLNSVSPPAIEIWAEKFIDYFPKQFMEAFMIHEKAERLRAAIVSLNQDDALSSSLKEGVDNSTKEEIDEMAGMLESALNNLEEFNSITNPQNEEVVET